VSVSSATKDGEPRTRDDFSRYMPGIEVLVLFAF